MSDPFATNAAQAGATTPAAGSTYLDTHDQSWQPCGADGFWIKPLWQSDDATKRTWLMKIDPGATSAAHAHEEIEQIFVLEGSFYDDAGEVGPGGFVCRAPGAIHTAGSRTGATMLLVYMRPD